jgi:tRNA pseudouridine13 synthase
VRLKTIPEDFRVRELLEWPEVSTGSYVVHRLHKEKLSTAEALALLARECNVDRAAIAYAGLKDRQAVTDQFLTIERRAVDLRLHNLRVQPVGTTDRPITSRQSSGNAFTIVLRDLQPPKAAQLRRALPSLLKTGFRTTSTTSASAACATGRAFRCAACCSATTSARCSSWSPNPRRSRSRAT